MRRFRIATIGLVISAFLGIASVASAQTLGTTTMPSGSTATGCTPAGAGAFGAETATDSSYGYVAPAAGAIDSWSTNTTSDTAGASVTLLVMTPSAGSYTVTGFDTETLPTPLPASGVASFGLAQPIAVSPGDVIGLFSGGAFTCAFSGGTIPGAETGALGTAGAAPTNSATYTAGPGQSSFLINVSANFVQTQDVSVTGAATPSSIAAGNASEYAFTVTNSGPGTAPITFTDTVPAGLTILSAAAGSGTCSTAGQTVTCTINGLAAGSTAPVLVIVSTASTGSYPDTATVSIEYADPTPADNSASATLDVTAPAGSSPASAPGSTQSSTTSCRTVSLAGAPLSIARTVIPSLDCKFGKVTSRASKKVRKGYVISTSPGPGKRLAAGTAINFVVSSGPPKAKKHKPKSSKKAKKSAKK